ncbi:hypothetical protein Y032_0006g2826 [Ancylostoma ceylanicum]|nr:hypothetical protein Y032_0006g2826 [Ancylostoma ceylanicum]
MAVNVPQTVFEALSVVVYCFVLIVIITSKQRVFKTAFYLVFVATGCADVISIFVNGFLRIKRQLGLGPDYQHVASFCVSTSGYTFVVHMLGNLIIAFNRYSAVCLGQHYEKIWTTRNTWIAVVFQYFISIAAIGHTIGAKMTYVHNPDGSYTFTSLEKRIDVINRFIYFGVCLIYAIISVILNVLLMYKFHHLSRLNENVKQAHHEKRLFLYTLIVFAFSLLMCAQQIGKVFVIFSANTDFLTWISIQFFWINDAMVSLPPYSLLMLCSHLRQDTMDFLRCKRQRSTALPVSTSNTRIMKMKTSIVPRFVK